MTITDCPPHEPYEALLDRLLHQLPPTRAAYPAFLDSLSQRDRHLLVLQGLHSQVCNGGFAQWISNRYAVQDGPTVLLALDRMRQQGSQTPLPWRCRWTPWSGRPARSPAKQKTETCPTIRWAT
ncbi:DMP19 family protein [Deinococcus multiflagellatus]|uniref:DUF4375 domain-containing protein n=1 Tax=Deinococcus multiflagellatus TaxID=1656887 RepID=A0ABW1ZR20_9DEIO